MKTHSRIQKKTPSQATIISVTDNQVVIELNHESERLKIGERIMATAPSARTTAIGNHKKLSDVVISGRVAKVEGKTVTVTSKITQPIVKPITLKKVCSQRTPIAVKKISSSIE